MAGRQEDEDEVWRPSWETDDEVDPPGAPRPRELAIGRINPIAKRQAGSPMPTSGSILRTWRCAMPA
jgi:hypothetical protein